jgi:hypothetical protein
VTYDVLEEVDMNITVIQGGAKVGIQYIVYKLLCTYFWPTLYESDAVWFCRWIPKLLMSVKNPSAK